MAGIKRAFISGLLVRLVADSALDCCAADVQKEPMVGTCYVEGVRGSGFKDRQ